MRKTGLSLLMALALLLALDDARQLRRTTPPSRYG